MLTRHTRGSITWVDLESPTREELADVMREFHIDPRIEEEIIEPTPYPIVVNFPTYLYLILHFPVTHPSGGTRNQEIDFIAGKDFLITARYEVIESLHGLHKIFESEELLGIQETPTHADVLLERILRRLYGAIAEETDRTSRTLERIEEDMFNGKEHKTIRAISDIGRVLLRFDTTLARHADPLATFLRGLSDPAFYGKQFIEHATHIEAERAHVSTLVNSYRSAASELRDTNDSILTASQSEVMKTLTVVTFIILPVSLVSALFQMNVQGEPFARDPNAFWWVVGLMAITGVSVYLFSKYKKWI